MSAKVLVGYATRYGSTQEVAEKIAETLRADGYKVDLLPARKVHSLDGYQAVVLGAPLFMFKWHADVLRVLSLQRRMLERLPVALFALGPFHNTEEEIISAREQLDKELAKFPWLKPVDIQVFVGKFDPAKLGFPLNLVGPLKDMPASDERDWDAVHAWIARLPALLLLDAEWMIDNR